MFEHIKIYANKTNGYISNNRALMRVLFGRETLTVGECYIHKPFYEILNNFI